MGKWFPSNYLVSTQQSYDCFVVLLGLWLLLGCDNNCSNVRVSLLELLCMHTNGLLSLNDLEGGYSGCNHVFKIEEYY